MTKLKVLVTDHQVPKLAIDLLKKKCEVILNREKPKATRQQIIAKAPGVHAIFWRTKERLDKEVLDAAGPQLKAVATMTAGYDHIDVAELRKRGIKFGHAAGVIDNPVSDIAVLLALAAARRTKEGQALLASAKWYIGHQLLMGRDMDSATVGIVGLGGIGQAIVRRLKGFDVCKFLYTDAVEKKEAKALEAEFVTLDALAKRSDFLFVSCPLNDKTRGMINESVFTKMKRKAVLVNVARGEVVNQEHLIRALKNRTIDAAGLDVTVPEPLPPDHELLKLRNCFILPHVGAATWRTREGMAKLAAVNILKALEGQAMLTPVK